MAQNPNYGVIQEQGFVTENSNLGFKPLSEAEKEKIAQQLDKNKK